MPRSVLKTLIGTPHWANKNDAPKSTYFVSKRLQWALSIPFHSVSAIKQQNASYPVFVIGGVAVVAELSYISANSTRCWLVISAGVGEFHIHRFGGEVKRGLLSNNDVMHRIFKNKFRGASNTQSSIRGIRRNSKHTASKRTGFCLLSTRQMADINLSGVLWWHLRDRNVSKFSHNMFPVDTYIDRRCEKTNDADSVASKF